MKNKKIKIIEEAAVYQGKFFEVLTKKLLIDNQEKIFETVKRSPGVRLIIINVDKILLTREYRYEFDDYDYRLPGGKVFNSLGEYNNFLNTGRDIKQAAQAAAAKEAREETGLIIENLEYLETVSAGATVIWDLFIFVARDFSQDSQGQQLEVGEDIEVFWKSFEEVKNMCLNGEIKEDRAVGVLLKYLIKNNLA